MILYKKVFTIRNCQFGDINYIPIYLLNKNIRDYLYILRNFLYD